MAALSIYLIQKFNRLDTKLWYHNHDVIQKNKISRFSLMRLAIYGESKIFSKLSLFTLPSNERKVFFPMKSLKGEYRLLPNYPLASFYDKFYQNKKHKGNGFILIYQGRVSDSHGLEEIIYLKIIKQIQEIEKLIIIGPIEDEFKLKIDNIIRDTEQTDCIDILSQVSYEKLLDITSSADIGIAINIPKTIMYSTGGTASNKIYEYAGLGLPVLYYDAPTYRDALNKFEWAIPTDLSKSSLSSAIDHIVKHYKELSSAARKDFGAELHFESEFSKVIDILNFKF